MRGFNDKHRRAQSHRDQVITPRASKRSWHKRGTLKPPARPWSGKRDRFARIRANRKDRRLARQTLRP